MRYVHVLRMNSLVSEWEELGARSESRFSVYYCAKTFLKTVFKQTLNRLFVYLYRNSVFLSVLLGSIIEQGQFSLWCESINVDAFMQQVQKLCNPALRKQIGRAARDFLEKHYTVQHSYNIIMNHFAGGKPCSTTKPC